uniref:Uncharacterized protein n=1 Tax=Solanum lycopersicum TaxID=4081 RepID=K4B5L7_SOLLC
MERANYQAKGKRIVEDMESEVEYLRQRNDPFSVTRMSSFPMDTEIEWRQRLKAEMDWRRRMETEIEWRMASLPTIKTEEEWMQWRKSEGSLSLSWYVKENEIDTISEVVNETNDMQSEALTRDPEPTHVFNPPNLDQAGSPAEEVQLVEEKDSDSLEDGRQVADEREIVVETE